MKPYTISEIDHLRSTVRRRTRLSPVEVEAQVQTYMMAGIPVADLIQNDEDGCKKLIEVVCLKNGRVDYCKGSRHANLDQ